MKPDRASRTADRVAERRAVHQVLDRGRVFEDPIALRIIRPDVARLIEHQPQKFDTVYDRHLRAFVSVRSRIAEDALGDAYGSGVRQYVVLGAGFDTFAYRNPFPDLRVWEVDHPATQAEKQRRVADASLVVPSTLTYAAADLAREPLADVLRDAGVDAAAPVFVSWLGVAMYLDVADVRHTLKTIGAMAPGTTIVFDYAVPPASLNLVARFFYRRVLARVASIGEPFKTFLDGRTAEAELRAAGFTSVTDAGPAVINARYFTNDPNRLKVGPAGGVILGRIQR
jgi:methyltransferase (TIGR00027 family)